MPDQFKEIFTAHLATLEYHLKTVNGWVVRVRPNQWGTRLKWSSPGQCIRPELCDTVAGRVTANKHDAPQARPLDQVMSHPAECLTELIAHWRLTRVKRPTRGIDHAGSATVQCRRRGVNEPPFFICIALEQGPHIDPVRFKTGLGSFFDLLAGNW